MKLSVSHRVIAILATCSSIFCGTLLSRLTTSGLSSSVPHNLQLALQRRRCDDENDDDEDEEEEEDTETRRNVNQIICVRLNRELTERGWGWWTVSIITIIVNVLSVLAIGASQGVMSANLRLICSLSLSDLLCGICGILDNSSVTMFSTCERQASKILLMTAHVTALLTLLGLAVDHYLAICRPLYHRTDANISRVNIAVIGVWIVSLICCSLDIILPVRIFSSHTLCRETGHFFNGIRFAAAVNVVSWICICN